MPPKLSALKRGDTFSYAGFCSLPPGNWAATCQVRSPHEPYDLLGTITVTLGTPEPDGTTPMLMQAPASITAAWPPDVYELDIRYVDSTGVVYHTSTVLLPVVRAITSGP